MNVQIFKDKSTNRPKHGLKKNVKTQGSGKIVLKSKIQNIIFYKDSATKTSINSQNMTNSQNWNMLTPQTMFLAQRVIPGVPEHSLHPPLIESSRRTDLDSGELPKNRIKFRRAHDEQN